MEKIKKQIKKFNVAFVGEHDWEKVRALLVLKLMECQTEEQFSIIIEGMLGSMFKDEKEMNEARKSIGAKLLTKKEKEKIRKIKEEDEKAKEQCH